jgi:hypothetical protein
MGVAEQAEDIRTREAEDEAERNHLWATTCAALDELAPEIATRCKRAHMRKTRLAGISGRHAWTFQVRTETCRGEASTCMHLGFFPDGRWVLIGSHHQDRLHYTQIVDKWAPFHPGLRQGFVFDSKRHEADVVFKFSGEQLREMILGQIPLHA